jgi:hypothetical protein
MTTYSGQENGGDQFGGAADRLEQPYPAGLVRHLGAYQDRNAGDGENSRQPAENDHVPLLGKDHLAVQPADGLPSVFADLR